jgi:hypothetical protein
MITGPSPAPPRGATVGAILWPSFFSAGVATMVFFALFDPVQLQLQLFPDWHIGRELGYTLGFFLFWVACAAASLFTWILLRPPERINAARGSG